MTEIEIINIDNPEEDPKLDLSILPERFLAITGRGDTAKAWEALEILATGEIPPHFLAERMGPSGQRIPYIKHVVVTKILNAALQYLWDFEVDPNVHIGIDGSVATICRLTIHFPMPSADGRIVYHKRVIQEVGAFPAYPMKKKVKVGQGKTGEAIMEEQTVRDENGNVLFTMCEADRIASAASRGLAKCVSRGFNLGIDLMDKEEAPMDYETARKLLLDYGLRKWGLTEEEVLGVLRQNGLNTKAKVVQDFGLAWDLIRKEGQSRSPGL